SVALQALRALVPARDPAIRVQHEDGVVADAMDEEPEAFLALPEGILRPASCRQIARHLAEAHELAGFIAQRRDDDVCPELGTVLPHPPAFVLDAPVLRRRQKRLERLA